MTETENSYTNPNFDEDPANEIKYQFWKENPFFEKVFSKFTQGVIFVFLHATKEGREMWRDPDLRNAIFNREGRVGLLSQAILAPALYHPNPEMASLELSATEAGRWVGYDFRRPEVFGNKVIKNGRVKQAGKLLLIDLEEYRDQNFTPSTVADLLLFRQILSLWSPDLDHFVNNGYIDETTYRTAYQRVGVWDKYGKYLELAGVANERVYQVTPKGNTLVFLEPNNGNELRECRESRVLRPALAI